MISLKRTNCLQKKIPSGKKLISDRFDQSCQEKRIIIDCKNVKRALYVFGRKCNVGGTYWTEGDHTGPTYKPYMAKGDYFIKYFCWVSNGAHREA